MAPTAPYDNLESVLNVARTRLNDAIQSLGGDILTDTQPFTGTITNSAWRHVQDYLANNGYSRLRSVFEGYAYPASTTSDPSANSYLDWTEYFNGTTAFVPPAVSVLPQDFILPLRLFERMNGSNSPFFPMTFCPENLPDIPKTRPFNRIWTWMGDAIWLPGCSQVNDLKVEYAAYLVDFPVDVDSVLISPTTQPVPIMRCQSAFANFLCAEMATGRDDVDVDKFAAAGMSDLDVIVNTEVKLKSRNPVSRRAYGHHGSWWSNSGRWGI